MSEFIEQSKDNLEKIEELNMLKKAMPNGQKLKRFIFTDNETLTHQVLNLYPDSTNIIIINNDSRDGLGVPAFTTKQLRQRFANITYSQGKRVLRSLEYEMYQIIVCVVDQGIVHAKKMVNSEFKEFYY